VRAYGAERGVAIEVRRFRGTTRTAADAAREIGCDVRAIVKSLAFVAGGQVAIALCSGADRVDERRLAMVLGAASVRRATADETKRHTGYAIGGVPPFAHETRCRVVADERLLALDEVWAAAGLPDAVFPIAPAELVRVADAEVVAIAAI
jgi:prolyl-tRNA editing enzyme YbaK/EbsC (Cys-tRNA(Pro) deacylase)